MNNPFPKQTSRFQDAKKPISVNKTIKPVPREDANVEAERFEQLVTDLDFDGLPEQYVIGGESHANGGTPLNVPENSFIFSKDKTLKLKDPEVQKEFGKSEKKSGYTMAELAKKYDINKFQQVLADPDSDDLQRKTATAMIASYNEKLGKLSLVQESMKGFPDGVPAIAMPYLESTGFDPTTIMGTQAEEETPDADQAKYGGSMKRKIQFSGLPKAQKGKAIQAHTPTELEVAKLLSPGTDLSTEEIPATQSQNEAGTFGKFNEDVANKNLKEWYDKPVDWAKPEQVQAMGKAFNETLRKKILKAGYNTKFADTAVDNYGFTSKKGLPNSLDAAAGKYHETRKMLDVNPATPESLSAAEASTKEPDLGPVKKNDISFKKGVENDPKFWTQDIINSAGAFRDLNSIKKYNPYIATTNLVTPETTYSDPGRELAANAENANISELINAMYAGPQRLAAGNSAIQGKAGENAANIMSRHNNLNVAEANRNAENKANILNENNKISADRATELSKQTNIVNQQFDNSKMALRKNLRDALNNAITNRGTTQNLNTESDQFQIDPTTGYKYFNKARPYDKAELSKKQTSAMDNFGAQMKALTDQGYTKTEAIDAMKVLLGHTK